MESKIITKIIISSIIFIIMLTSLICIMVFGLPINAISSVDSIFKQKEKLIQAESNLVSTQSGYQNAISSVETAKSNFENQKKKYEAISDETIRIIKDAYTTQDYTIEYMWIKLGNYATKNRLSIVLVEPGGTTSDSTTNEETITSTSDESKNEETITSTSDESKNEETNNLNNSNNGVTNSNLKIKITGSYLDISNFIFELESDSELKFRLDNILMELVSGTKISATFEVKNVVINK